MPWGNTCITGNFIGTVDFDPGPGTVFLTSGGEQDVFVAKYDVYGNYLFAKALGRAYYDYSQDIALDGAGNIFITGYFSEPNLFEALVASATSAGGNDIFVAKYDASGNQIYAIEMGGVGSDISYGIAVDGSGNAYITGVYYGSVDFDPGAGTAILTSAGLHDIFYSAI